MRFFIHSCRQIISPFWTSSKWAHFRVEHERSYLTHYRSAFAYSNLLYLQGYRLSYDSPSFVTNGALQTYHVPPLKHVDLAACYRPKGIIDDEEVNPQLPPYLLYHGTAIYRDWLMSIFQHRFRCLRHIHYLLLTRGMAPRRIRRLRFGSRTFVLRYFVRPALYSGS